MFDKLEDQLIMSVNPNLVRYFAKIRPWQRRLKFLKRIGMGRAYNLIKTKQGLIFNKPLKLKPFSEHEKYIFIKELWDNDFDYTRTVRYKRFNEMLERGKTISMPVKGYVIADARKLTAYFQDYVDLLKSMRTNGYLSDKSQEELQVIIGAKGELIKASKGRHRLAAAQITQIAVIPVRVRHIHADWINKNAQKADRALSFEDKIIIALDKTRQMYGN